MVKAPAVRHRAQSLGEEIANSISHGTGFLAALIGLPVLVIDAVRTARQPSLPHQVFRPPWHSSTSPRHSTTRWPRIALSEFSRFSTMLRYTSSSPGPTRLSHWAYSGDPGVGRSSGSSGPSPLPNCSQIGRGSSTPSDFDWALRGHGVVDSGRGKAVVARDAWVGSLLARGRRCRVHNGGWILCRQPDAVRPLCVAPVRTHRRGVSLHCRATLRGLTGAFAPWPRASQPRGGVPHPRPVRADRGRL